MSKQGLFRLWGARSSVDGGLLDRFCTRDSGVCDNQPIHQKLPSIRYTLICLWLDAFRAIQTVDFAASHMSVLVPETLKIECFTVLFYVFG